MSTYGVIVSQVPAATTGVGLPDNTSEVRRGKAIGGNVLEFGEAELWITYVACETPGAAVITRGPIAPAEGWVDVPDAFTGLSPTPIGAGVDYVLKEMWCSFDQPSELELFQGGSYNDVSCLLEVDSRPANPINPFTQGWTRGQLENLALASTIRLRIRNRGYQPMLGKCWIIGTQKTGNYRWY